MHPLGNRAENHEVCLALASAKHDVFDQPCTVTEAKGATTDDGILDALDAVGLTGVNRDRKHLARQVVEGRLVAVGHKALLWAGYVEANHAIIAVANGKFGNLKTAIKVAHGGDQLAGANALTLVLGGVCALL